MHYWCEDRCPDLSQKQAQEKLGYKYKHHICVRVGWKSVSLIVRSLTQGSYFNPWEEKGVHRNEHPIGNIPHLLHIRKIHGTEKRKEKE